MVPHWVKSGSRMLKRSLGLPDVERLWVHCMCLGSVETDIFRREIRTARTSFLSSLLLNLRPQWPSIATVENLG